jgi:hypothetical protein
MKTMIKKTVLLLALALCTGAGFAQTSGTDGRIDWSFSDGTLTISKAEGGDGVMRDYGRFNNLAPWLQHFQDSITAVDIKKGVVSIGSFAFHYCGALTSVTIPESVTAIGETAFRACYTLPSITIPKGITVIEQEVFASCAALTSVTIPESVTIIGDRAFGWCAALTSITIPANVTTIGEYAFGLCSALTSITIPANVTTLGGDAFGWCSALTSVIMPGATPPILGKNVFRDIPSNCILMVPAGAESAYDSWKPWFAKIMAGYHVTVSAGAGGSATGGGFFTAGTSIVLTAVPDSGYVFAGWSDGYPNAVYNYTVPAAHVTLTAHFAADTPDPPGTQPTMRQVIIPDVPGITTDPAAGAYFVPSGEDFVFTVTPIDAQHGQTLIVKDGRRPSGVECIRNNDGTWKVRVMAIRQNIVLTIDFSTAETVTEGDAVWSAGRELHITSSVNTNAWIYNIVGSLVRVVAVAAGETHSIPLPPGIYIVEMNEESYKEIVK